MDEATLSKLKRRATQAMESSRGDGFAEVVLELVAHIEGLNRHTEQAIEPLEMEVASELDPTPPKRKRKVAEAGGDLSRAD